MERLKRTRRLLEDRLDLKDARAPPLKIIKDINKYLGYGLYVAESEHSINARSSFFMNMFLSVISPIYLICVRASPVSTNLENIDLAKGKNL